MIYKKEIKMKISKIAIIIMLLYLIPLMAQTTPVSVNTKYSFSNGEIVSSDDLTIRGNLKKSNQPYDEYMIGIYHTSLKDNSDPRMYEIPFKDSGAYYVKCNSENGKIRKGDLVTSSSESGVAMKATKSGMVLGLALENANEATGQVKVRLTIQYVKQSDSDSHNE